MSVHVTATRDGCRISCDDRERLPDGSGVVRFNGAAVHVPVPMMDIRGVLLNGQRAVVGSGINDQAYRVLEIGDIRHISVQTSGRNAVLATPTNLFIVKAPGTHYTRNGGPDIPIPHGGTSQGLLEVDANGDPIWVDDWGTSGRRRYAPHDVWMVQVQTDGDFTSGTEALAEPGRYLVHRHSTDELRMAPYEGDVSLPAQILDMGAGDCLLSLSGPVLSPPASNWLRWDELVPYVPQTSKAFTVEPYDAPKFIGVFFGSSDREDYKSHIVADTNCEVLVHSTGPAHQRRDLPAFCSPSALAAGRPKRLLGVYCESVDAYDECRRVAEAMQVPCALYTDGLIYDDRYRALVRLGDTLWLQVYPRKGSGPLHNQPDGVAESPDSVEARAVAEFDRIAAWGQNQIVIVAGWFDRLVDLTADEIRAYLPGYDRLIRRARCAGMFAFPYGRPGGILTLGLTAELSAFGRASSGVPTFRTEPTPPPIDPKDPPPVDDPIDPDEGDDDMPKERMSDAEFTEFREHVGGTIALNLGVPPERGNQLAREVVNFFNATAGNLGPDPTVPEAIEFARALHNATSDKQRVMLGKAAEISVRLRR